MDLSYEDMEFRHGWLVARGQMRLPTDTEEAQDLFQKGLLRHHFVCPPNPSREEALTKACESARLLGAGVVAVSQRDLVSMPFYKNVPLEFIQFDSRINITEE